MAYNAQAAIELARSLKGRVTYSMDLDKRDGMAYFDCSGMVYYILSETGAIDKSYLNRSHYTGTLKRDLEAAGFVEVSGDETQAGDVFIWGGNYGAAAGGACHTGFMTSNDTEISSCYYTQGQTGTAVQELNHDYYWALDGKPEYHFFHYQGGTPANVTPQDDSNQATTVAYKEATSIDKFKNEGNKFYIGGWMTVQDVQQVNNIWQVEIDELAKLPFDWTDNGIPCVVLETESGERNFNPGDRVKFKDEYRSGTIDEYDEAENAIGVDFIKKYGRIWFDADKAWHHE